MLSRPTSARRAWTDVGLVCAILVAIGLLLYLLSSALLPLILAGIAAYILTPIVAFIERRGLSRHAAIACLYGSFVVLMIGVVIVVIPPLDREIKTLNAELPRYSQEIDHAISALHDRVEHDLPLLAQFNFAKRIEQASVAHLTDMGERLPVNALLVVSTVLLVPFLTWYLLLDGAAMKKGLISCIPNAYFESSLNLIHRIDQHLSSYLFGQLINIVCIGLLSAIGYTLIGVQFGIAIGILSGVANVIPYVGSLVGASVALLVSMLDGSDMSKILSIVLVSTAIYAFDHLVLKTVIISKTTDLHPLTVIMVLVVAGHLGGLWGLLIGIPMFCIAKIVAEEIIGVLRRRRPPVSPAVAARPMTDGLLPPF